MCDSPVPASHPAPYVDPRQAAAFIERIARGVHAAHMAGLVHCDLKPNNVVLSVAGEPKVADFGIAIRATDPGPAVAALDESGDDEPLGNLAFMSPEQFRMEPGALTIPSDVYALGGMLYWMVTGELPNGSTPEEIRRQVRYFYNLLIIDLAFFQITDQIHTFPAEVIIFTTEMSVRSGLAVNRPQKVKIFDDGCRS